MPAARNDRTPSASAGGVSRSWGARGGAVPDDARCPSAVRTGDQQGRRRGGREDRVWRGGCATLREPGCGQAHQHGARDTGEDAGIRKGAVRVAPTDASLIVRPSSAAMTREPGAFGSEPMRDPLVHLHRWKLRRSLRNSALRLPPGPRSSSRDAFLRPCAFPWHRGASGFSRFAPSAGAAPRDLVSDVRLSPCRTRPIPFAVRGSCAGRREGESAESASWDFSG